MKVFVTGVTGFIGGNLARSLVKQGYTVRALVRDGSNRKNINGLDIDTVTGDLRNPELDLEKAIKGCEAVFHAAAIYSFWTPDHEAIIEANVKGTQKILEAAMRAGAVKVVFTSSESTVAASRECPGKEEAVIDISKLYGDYKQSKLLAEQIALRMWQEHKFPVVVVNPTMPIGAYDIKPTPTGQVIVDYLNRKMPAYVNSGMNVADVHDVAAGHVLALEKGRPGERYILGNRNVTYQELLLLIEKASGIKAPRLKIPVRVALSAAYLDEFITGKIRGKTPRVQIAAVRAAAKYRYHDCTKAVRELGLPQSPVEAAFTRAIVWFQENGYVHGN